MVDNGDKDALLEGIEEHIRLAKKLREDYVIEFILSAAGVISNGFLAGNKVLVAGNGGSMCDGMHFAQELTGKFRSLRRGFAAIALSDPAHLSCVANDISFEDIFARGVEALGKSGDIFLGLSTSGKSVNIIKAVDVAKKQGLYTIAMLGKGGGDLKGLADKEIIIEGSSLSDKIQEMHMAILHLVVEQIEIICGC